MPRSFSIPSSSRAGRPDHLTLHSAGHSITRPLRSVRSALHRVRESRSVSTPLTLQLPESIPDHRTPQEVISFANTLSDTKLSRFLLWFLEHDLVEPPKSPSQWFNPIPEVEVRGWIALGQFLSTGAPYGLNLVVFTSCCDRMYLDKNTVHNILVRLSDPAKVAWSQLSATIQEAQQARITETEMLQLVRSKILSLRALAMSLKPAEGSKAAEVQVNVLSRVKEFINYVVDPRLDELGALYSPLLHQGDILEKRREMSYWFEVMQRPREVPAAFYNVDPHSRGATSSTPSWQTTCSPPTVEHDHHECEAKHSAEVNALQTEVGQLRGRITDLEHEVDRLYKEKQVLMQRLTQLRSSPPEAEFNTLSPMSTESSILPDTPTPAPRAVGGTRHRYSPPAAIRHRRLLTPISAEQSPQAAPASSSSPPVAESSDYDDIFQPFDRSNRLSLGLMSPVTDATSPPAPEARPPLPRDVGSMDLRADLNSQSSPSHCASDSRPDSIDAGTGEIVAHGRVAANPTVAASRSDGVTERSPSPGRSQRSRLRRKGSIGNALNSLFRRKVSGKEEG